MNFVRAGGHRLEYAWFGTGHDAAHPLVMLHEGLGSLSQWRDFPGRLAGATGRRVLAYSRYGYGRSDPIAGPRSVDFMHVEALATLPELLAALDVKAPVLFGHSDGGSIALLHAGSGGPPVRAVIALAPHVMVEPVSVASIAQVRQVYLDTDLRARLARHHEHVDSAFWGWNDIWLHPDFLTWNIEAVLPAIGCPVLAIQGLDDEYGTLEQIRRVAHGARDVELVELSACGHSPQRDQPERVLEATVRFLARVA
jgi:pimeloyl-ACP methyl ester carboxylesterase